MKELKKYLDYHLFIHSLFFIAITILVYLWATSPHTPYYSLQLSLIFLILYFLTLHFSHRLKTSHHPRLQPLFNYHYQRLIDTSLTGGVILLLISLTGGVTSPWFFLIYFYLFSVGLLLEKEAIGIYTLVIFIFFSLLPLEGSLTHYFIRLLSLLLIAPLAYYLGYKYQEVKEIRQKYSQLEQTESKVESTSLLGLKLKVKPSLLASIDKMTTIMPQLNPQQREIIGEVIALNKGVLKELQEITTEIDKLGDKISSETEE